MGSDYLKLYLGTSVNPVDLCKGIPASSAILPENITLFNRKHSNDLHDWSVIHYRYGILLCLEGEGIAVTDDIQHHLVPQTALVLFPHQPHYYINNHPQKINWWFIQLEMPLTPSFNQLKNTILKISSASMRMIEDLIESYQAQDGAPSAFQQNKITLLTALLLNEFLIADHFTPHYEDTEKTLAHKKSSIINQVNDYISNNLDRPITIENIAKEVTLSPSYLRDMYKKAIGISIHEYINQSKIRKAKKLLEISSLNITEVGTQCGFDTVYSFSRFFKNRVGVSPKRYQKLLYEKGIVSP